MKLTSVKVRHQDADIQKDLSNCEEYFKEGMFQFSSAAPTCHIELRENKNSTFMESFYQRLSKILVYGGPFWNFSVIFFLGILSIKLFVSASRTRHGQGNICQLPTVQL
jgi:hypothetical protein